ncbi:FHA domain-containing protein [Cryobacterium sinapicolor]|uniref:FHA domain-containing protein n=1 Tax=Cryobacterium sinapicolor TaxID=1259236 RepID=A0ABY2JGV2_9MICO|nr:FHA domain-containing protein [Cryobacterium sinapicolor]TFD04333.1 FHA domain-containing protein [Cryobacterium sinapicolor]
MGRVGFVTGPGTEAAWTFVVGRGFIAAMPVGTPSGVILTLAALVTEPHVEAEELVALLPLGGEHAVENFAVIVQRAPTDEDGIPVSVIVRGEVAVDVYSVGGSRRFSAGGIRPWLLADFRAVIGFTVGSTGRPVASARARDSGRPFGLGSVFANTLSWSLAEHGQSESTPADAALTYGAFADDATIVRAGAPGATGSAADEDTVLGPVGTDTLIPGGRAAPGHVVRGPSAGEGVRAAEPRFALRLPDGEQIPLDLPCRLGRRPRQTRIAAATPARLIEVASPTSAVSGTHVEIRQEGGSVVVTDLGSTNGTVVAPPRGRRQRLRSGQSLTVLPGTTVHIGDGNIIEILPAPGMMPGQ